MDNNELCELYSKATWDMLAAGESMAHTRQYMEETKANDDPLGTRICEWALIELQRRLDEAQKLYESVKHYGINISKNKREQ